MLGLFKSNSLTWTPTYIYNLLFLKLMETHSTWNVTFNGISWFSNAETNKNQPWIPIGIIINSLKNLKLKTNSWFLETPKLCEKLCVCLLNWTLCAFFVLECVHKLFYLVLSLDSFKMVSRFENQESFFEFGVILEN